MSVFSVICDSLVDGGAIFKKLAEIAKDSMHGFVNFAEAVQVKKQKHYKQVVHSKFSGVARQKRLAKNVRNYRKQKRKCK